MVKIIIRKLAKIILLTDVIKKTSWWKERYAHMEDFKPQPIFRADHQRNYEAIVLGSDTAANDYKFDSELLGLNLSTGYQPIDVDNKILQFYHSYLRCGGFVLININPFSFFKQEPLTDEYYSRFIMPLSPLEKQQYGDYYASNLRLLDNTQLPSTINKFMDYPMLYAPVHCIRALLGCKSQQQKLINFEFTGRDAEVLSKIILFCKDRDYRPVVVITPLPSEIAQDISEEEWINMENKVKDSFAPNKSYILNYARQNCWQVPELFVNKLYLNTDNRIKFAQQVMNDAKALYGTI